MHCEFHAMHFVAVRCTHHTVRTKIGSATVLLSLSKHAVALNTTMHINIDTLAQTPLEFESPLAESDCYRIGGTLAAASVGFGRQRGAGRDGFASKGPREHFEERSWRYYRVEVQPQYVHRCL